MNDILSFLNHPVCISAMAAQGESVERQVQRHFLLPHPDPSNLNDMIVMALRQY